jgi:hypothetical protein
VVFTDTAGNNSGKVFYQHRATLLARIVWDKIVYQEHFEDPQKVQACDTYDAKPPILLMRLIDPEAGHLEPTLAGHRCSAASPS